MASLPRLSPGHIRHTSAVQAVCGQFTAENRGDRRITLRVPQGVGLNRRGRAVENQWSWGRREVCEHVRKSVYGPRLPYGHLLT